MRKFLSVRILTTASLFIIMSLIARPSLCQEQPALRGLGEPAAPASMAAPGALGPATPAQPIRPIQFAQPSIRPFSNRELQNIINSYDTKNIAIPKSPTAPAIPAVMPQSSPTSPPATTPPATIPPGTPSANLTSPPNAPDTPNHIILRPAIEKNSTAGPLKLSGAVSFADQNYPSILRTYANLKAAQENITVQKLNEYLPDSLFQTQEIFASRNKPSQTFYGSPVFPGMMGPGFPAINMNPLFFSGLGFNLDWAPIDFGLHKARINLSKSQFGLAQAQTGVTRLDAEVNAASSFLDVIEALNTVAAVQENVNSFKKFSEIVHAQVEAQLKPGADEALANAQVAIARNQLYRARLNYDVAKADLSNALGIAGSDVDINDSGLISAEEKALVQIAAPVFEQVPVLQLQRAAVLTAALQRKVLDKEYYPAFHWLAGFNLRGTAVNNSGARTWQDAAGVIPIIPNYQVALIINWNFLDWFRLHAEKKVQDQRIIAEQYQYNLILNNLKTEDTKSRARVRAAISIAENMPVQIASSEEAVRQATSRYKVGLSSVAQVAEANQVLAQSRMQMAVAKINVWRAMLAVASVHGDLKPFLAEADRIQQ